ncbi:tRNA nucleotidyltransferase/poly(A) polymerase [Granulicella rosea]|uniref:tRNA nucleotidyltransferase/poly(A) polymerase n=1 Tax=Granulicella rosea TaxID=474952 RepID=A0A239H5A6_9BACT|nr:CCA tRNA nucleotidyltransferase [Granulicella rosea]SNS76198.1 tRNA nucleotidyltransferase/poly(A) polymerase [Granulicella rosea]
MADYIYLLEHRLSPAQKTALETVRELARSKGYTVFLVGGAVRDLTSGSPVRDLDVAIQGNALKLKKDLAAAGAVISGEIDAAQALFVRFAGGVRMEISSTLNVTWPKPGKPVAKPGTILEDLRRRDFTANAMALSLNIGSYGLLMDPTNGVADIENRQLRLVSNYGFIEDPVRMVRAARLMARLGWTMEEKTQTRYDNGRTEGYISAMQEIQRGYELEEIVHEEDPLRVLRGLETEGWMKFLAPFWNSTKVNTVELDKLRETLAQLQIQGVQPDPASAYFPLLTAKLLPKEVESIKKSFVRTGFATEIDTLEAEAKEFATQLTGKAVATPSQAWKLITSANPEAVLWVAYSSKSAAAQAKFKSFFGEWPAVRQKIPYSLMQEMRITPELPEYAELVEKLFFELMDGRLGTVEELKAFLEPYSPPAPPPPVSMRRVRASKKDAKAKGRGRKAAAKLDDGDDDLDDDDVDLDDDDDDDDEVIDLPPIDDEEIPGLDDDAADESDSDDDADVDSDSDADAGDLEDGPAPAKAAKKTAAKKSAAKAEPVAKAAPVKTAAKKAVKAAKVKK